MASDAFTTYTENKVLDHIVAKTNFPSPVTCAVALYTTACTDAGGGTEVTNANGYARVDTAGTDWNAAVDGITSNVNNIAFPTCVTAQWGTVTHFAIHDSATWGGGNMLAWGQLTTPKLISVGDTATFAGGTPGDLVITLD